MGAGGRLDHVTSAIAECSLQGCRLPDSPNDVMSHIAKLPES
jgi:hypothetical protein